MTVAWPRVVLEWLIFLTQGVTNGIIANIFWNYADLSVRSCNEVVGAICKSTQKLVATSIFKEMIYATFSFLWYFFGRLLWTKFSHLLLWFFLLSVDYELSITLGFIISSLSVRFWNFLFFLIFLQKNHGSI